MANYDRFWVGVLMGDMERLGINSEFFASNNHLSSLLPVEMSSRLHSDRTLLPQFEQLIRESAARPDPKVREYAEQWKKKNGAPLDWHYPNSF
ncbi:MAG: hypothetical protein HYW48_06155 [Deltaproteobacteria bacterium]|nr:hypothetical protein [Deltaproteobacteria bacterium]